MKLTNQQANAVAEKIFNEAKAAMIAKQNQQIRALKAELLKLYKKELRILTSCNFIEVVLPYGERFITFKNSNGTVNVSDWDCKQLLKHKSLSIDTIKNEIILATIDASDLQELIRVVSLKYQ